MYRTKNNSWIIVFKLIGYFLLFYVCCRAKIVGRVAPAFYGVFLSLLFLGESPFYLISSFLCASGVSDATTSGIVFSLVCALSAFGIFSFYKKTARDFALWKRCIYTFVIGLVYVALNAHDMQTIYLSSASILLNTLIMLCISNFVSILLVRKFNFNLNVDEAVCGAVGLVVLFCGLASFNLPFDLVKLFALSFILFAFAVMPSSFGVVGAILCGLGPFLYNGSLQYITLLSVVSLFVFIFKNQNKLYAILSVVTADLALNLFLGLFGEITIFTFMPTAIACGAYYMVPGAILGKLKSTFYIDDSSKSLKNILNQNKAQTSKKLLYTAEVFYEMDKSFRKLVKGSMDPKSAKMMLCNEVIRENCETCHLRNRCLKSFGGEHRRVFDNLINVGFEKGKITLVDLPQFLTTKCTKLSKVVGSINSLLSEYSNYAKMTSELDSSKLLVAEQLKGISSVLSKLSCETKENVNMDHKLEKQIKENLIYQNIVPSEVVCFEKDTETSIISMIVRSIDFDNEKISKVLSSVCHHKMVLDDITETQEGNLAYLSYKTAPTYELAVGVATETKGGSEESGDSHALVKLGSEKFMLALCDGMGSGKVAGQKSETSLNIIENFYKAGYDDETILSSVNKLLNLNSENVFSALDLSVVDLKNGEIDFVKQGATVGFVKHGEEVHKIESSSLPLGILDDIKPKITKSVLSPDDTVFMMSDGVVDALGEDKISEYISIMSPRSPQEFADNILQKAKTSQNGYPADDMTVIACKIFYNAS